MNVGRKIQSWLGAAVMGACVVIWGGIFIYPAFWHILTDDACYRRYGHWRLSSRSVGHFSLPFYDLLHQQRFPAHNAVLRNQMVTLTSIPQEKLNPDRLDSFAMTPLAYAARSGLKDALHYLLTKGAAPNVRTYQDMTALIHAIRNDRREAAMLLLEYGADPSLADKTGVTSIHLVAEKNYDTVLGKIADAKHNLSIKDAKGLTPLDYAIKKGSTKIVIQLAASGADCSFSLSPDHSDIATFLRRWQEAGITPFTLPVMAEAENSYTRPIPTDEIPAELPVNVKPQTFKNRGLQ
ncbi:MAG: ankyrin 2,3/unc44-like protein [uncultured bacterium]|nr:MAG: ankyrin 2,3/unc44-like protein [uncultured bacterium]